MSEKTYKTMSTVGGGNIALGIVVLVTQFFRVSSTYI